MEVNAMNTPNNQRKKLSKEKIKKAFIEEIQRKELHQISVTDIVKNAHINRSTFYANYIDIYDLADKIKEEMYYNILELYKEESVTQKHSYNYLKLFKHIKDNPIYYKTLFKLKFDFSEYFDMHLEEKEALKYYGTLANLDYHIAFFKAGINAILKKWLFNGCVESPEELVEVLNSEYKGKSLES